MLITQTRPFFVPKQIENDTSQIMYVDEDAQSYVGNEIEGLGSIDTEGGPQAFGLTSEVNFRQ